VQKIQTLLIDDLDGTEAITTTRFALDGVSYELDLNPHNDAALRNILEPYVGAARPVKGKPSMPKGRSGQKASTVPDGTAVRQWCATQGIDVRSRGRIPREIMMRYLSAQLAEDAVAAARNGKQGSRSPITV
jgi:nucleoid-associated protein Lsr2